MSGPPSTRREATPRPHLTERGQQARRNRQHVRAKNHSRWSADGPIGLVTGGHRPRRSARNRDGGCDSLQQHRSGTPRCRDMPWPPSPRAPPGSGCRARASGRSASLGPSPVERSVTASTSTIPPAYSHPAVGRRAGGLVEAEPGLDPERARGARRAAGRARSSRRRLARPRTPASGPSTSARRLATVGRRRPRRRWGRSGSPKRAVRRRSSPSGAAGHRIVRRSSRPSTPPSWRWSRRGGRCASTSSELIAAPVASLRRSKVPDRTKVASQRALPRVDERLGGVRRRGRGRRAAGRRRGW